VPSETDADPAPGDREPDPDPLGPVHPGRPDARRPLPTTAEAEVEGPPCPVCGTANPPGRRFCRNCGTALDPTARPAGGSRRRWWRWRWRGDRSRWLRRLVALIVIVALVVTGILLWPRLVNLVDYLRDRTGKPVAVFPAHTVATAQVPGHPATAAVDGLTNRYWGASRVGDSIEFTFPRPFRLLWVIVHTGESTHPEDFIREARPSELDMVVTSADGVTRTIPVHLDNKPGQQRIETGISDVVRIRLVIRAAAGLAAGRHIALGEVEFFRRR
jgi:hypothetical protein